MIPKLKAGDDLKVLSTYTDDGKFWVLIKNIKTLEVFNINWSLEDKVKV